MDKRYDETKFESIKWKDIKENQVIWLKGTYQGEFKAYGPHTIINPKERLLENSEGEKFLHFPEDLLKEV